MVKIKNLISKNNLRFSQVEDKIVDRNLNFKAWYVLYICSAPGSFIYLSALLLGPSQFSFFNISILFLLLLFPVFCKKTNEYIIKNLLNYANTKIGPPHEVIDDFLDWKEGDDIETDHFSGYYQGLDNKKRVVLKKGGCYKCLPTGYFKVSGHVKNSDLRRRKMENNIERIENELKEDTEYEKILKEVKKEYKRLKSN